MLDWSKEEEEGVMNRKEEEETLILSKGRIGWWWRPQKGPNCRATGFINAVVAKVSLETCITNKVSMVNGLEILRVV